MYVPSLSIIELRVHPKTTSPQRGREGGGGQKYWHLLSKKMATYIRGREGRHRIGKMGRRSLWMGPNTYDANKYLAGF